MNDLVKMSIDGRKNAIFSAYNITEQSIKDKIENLFNKINELGESCVDNMDFESKFASSNLNQEYIDLFTEIATKCTQIVRENQGNRHVKSDAEKIVDDVASEIRYQVKDATLPMRRQMRQEAYDKARNTPIIGEIMEAKQYADFFGRFKKKKKDKDKENKEGKKED